MGQRTLGNNNELKGPQSSYALQLQKTNLEMSITCLDSAVRERVAALEVECRMAFGRGWADL